MLIGYGTRTLSHIAKPTANLKTRYSRTGFRCNIPRRCKVQRKTRSHQTCRARTGIEKNIKNNSCFRKRDVGTHLFHACQLLILHGSSHHFTFPLIYKVSKLSPLSSHLLAVSLCLQLLQSVADFSVTGSLFHGGPSLCVSHQPCCAANCTIVIWC